METIKQEFVRRVKRLLGFINLKAPFTLSLREVGLIAVTYAVIFEWAKRFYGEEVVAREITRAIKIMIADSKICPECGQTEQFPECSLCETCRKQYIAKLEGSGGNAAKTSSVN